MSLSISNFDLHFRWGIYLGLTLTLAVLSVAMINLTIDPLHFYHLSDNGVYSENERFQNPGLIKNIDYDSIVLGTSHSENFSPGLIREYLGGNPLKVSIAGAGIREQSLTLEKVFRVGKARRVVWLVDFDSFTFGDKFNDAVGRFPVELYREGPATPLIYLVNWDTLKLSWDAFRGHGNRNLETLNTWHDKHEFSESRTWAALDYMKARWQPRLKAVWAGTTSNWETIDDMLVRYIERPIRERPDISFDIVLPPYSALTYFNDSLVNERRFSMRLKFRTALIDHLARLENVRVHDFQPIDTLVTNLDNYKDLDHFSLNVTKTILRDVAERRHVVSESEGPRQNMLLKKVLSTFRAQRCPSKGQDSPIICSGHWGID
jgi:hypothetical protein